jgi:glutathione peroxidase
MTTVHDFSVLDSRGASLPLSAYRGKVLLIVNVASQCGYTPQYAGLQALHTKYGARGFEVLGFPCNQFGAQEPGSMQEVLDFCRSRYAVTFPLFSKLEVNGPGADPLFTYLKHSARGWLGLSRIRWNFTKFLVDRQGIPVRRYGSGVKPESLESDLARLLA